jgi:SMC interacting uncharacterized protein involved in chromosome segregation
MSQKFVHLKMGGTKKMAIDYNFIGLTFKKYSKHLIDVVESIESLIDGYDRQLNSLYKLDCKKYGSYIKELENKKSEAFKKLSDICPNIKKMKEQLQDIQDLVVKDVS